MMVVPKARAMALEEMLIWMDSLNEKLFHSIVDWEKIKQTKKETTESDLCKIHLFDTIVSIFVICFT